MTSLTSTPTTDTMVMDLVQKAYGIACRWLYGPFSWLYDPVSWLVSGGRWRTWQKRAIELVGAGTVLEVGTGPGHFMVDLMAQGRSIIGLDASASMLRAARRNAERAGLPALLVQADAQHLPFRDGHFDTVIAIFPAPFILECRALRECLRCVQRPDEAVRQGELVIFGLWAYWPSKTWTRWTPVFYGRPDRTWLRQVENRIRASGWIPNVRTVNIRGTEIGYAQSHAGSPYNE